jgi:organic hydroperoxide reductase OsmC/OhrA
MTASRTPWWSGRGGNQRSDFSCHVHAKNRGFVERVWSEALGVMNHSTTGSFINSTLPTMPTRKATATWSGDLPNGSGNMAFGSGAFEGAFSFRSRFEDGTGTNPEELIGAAHAGCFSMAFSNVLAEAGFTPERVDTTAHVTLEMTAARPSRKLHWIPKPKSPASITTPSSSTPRRQRKAARYPKHWPAPTSHSTPSWRAALRPNRSTQRFTSLFEGAGPPSWDLPQPGGLCWGA